MYSSSIVPRPYESVSHVCSISCFVSDRLWISKHGKTLLGRFVDGDVQLGRRRIRIRCAIYVLFCMYRCIYYSRKLSNNVYLVVSWTNVGTTSHGAWCRGRPLTHGKICNNDIGKRVFVARTNGRRRKKEKYQRDGNQMSVIFLCPIDNTKTVYEL